MVRIHAPEPTFRIFMHPVFVYGTLMVEEIALAVLRRSVALTPARLDDHFRGMIDGQVYPGIAPQEGSSVEGALMLGLSLHELKALDEYEGDLYERRPVRVQTDEQTMLAVTYVVCPQKQDRITRVPWDLSTFKRDHARCFGVTWD